MNGEAVVEQRIRCPYCAESMETLLDLSAGGQSYVEDCQVCCQPMQIRFEVWDGRLAALDVSRAQ